MFASSGAKTIQTVICNPLIVIKTRFEVVGFAEYANTWDAAKQIHRKEGLKGFFTGLKISLIRDVPFSGTFYPFYNFFKDCVDLLASRVHVSGALFWRFCWRTNNSVLQRDEFLGTRNRKTKQL